jgi:hypothetical protein
LQPKHYAGLTIQIEVQKLYAEDVATTLKSLQRTSSLDRSVYNIAIPNTLLSQMQDGGTINSDVDKRR